MKLWIDDVRPAPKGYYWVRSVNEAKRVICDPFVCKNHPLKIKRNFARVRDDNIAVEGFVFCYDKRKTIGFKKIF